MTKVSSYVGGFKLAALEDMRHYRLRARMILNTQPPVILPRKLISLLALLCCAVTFAAPSSARGAHFIAHAQTSAEPGEFHSHDHDAAPAIDASREAPFKSPDAPEGKSGHSHMSSSAFDLNYSPGQQARPSKMARSDALAPADEPDLANTGSSPPVRPPRTA